MFRILSRNTVHSYTHPHNKRAPLHGDMGGSKVATHPRKCPT